jgi:cell wall-associated NlpC family hydrolase
MRRRSVLCALVTTLVLALAPAGAAKSTSWAQPQIKAVVTAGLMAPDTASFRPDDLLTRGALEELVAGLTQATPVTPANPGAKVTVAGLDARLVNALGLSATARLFTEGARAAGLAVPARFGNEATARLLGLRTNHPASQDELELLPGDPATRAETAFSAAKVLRFSGWETQYARDAAATFVLPALTPWQKRILTTAFRFIGYPYIWGGESENPESPFGHQARGGFDCSGFVWRVYKLEAYPSSGTLAGTLHGPASKPAQIGHMGIYVGGGWFVHSSGYGVALAQMTSGWYRNAFAWGRRPLAEAGLTA